MRLKTTTLWMTASLLALSACSGDTTPNLPPSTTVEMKATHAFDTQTPIKSLTFVPNNVAPWLGRLILLNESGQLFSTDIEGSAPIRLSPKPYIDAFGLSLDNAAGVVLAINGGHRIEAYVESDNEGRFSAMALSGAPLEATQFCSAFAPASDEVKLLSTDGNITDLAISITDQALEYTETSHIGAPKGTIACGYDANTIFALTQTGKGKMAVKALKGGSWVNLAVPADITGFSPILLSETTYHAYIGNGHKRFQSVSDDTSATQVEIIDGLSIKGMKNISFITSTTAKFGGAAFNSGVIAMIDADAPRIVFISREYAERKLSPQ